MNRREFLLNSGNVAVVSSTLDLFSRIARRKETEPELAIQPLSKRERT